MARPRSEEKHLKLLLAAAELIAERGVAAQTASISQRAGVAEGTMFRYFATKEVLFNELYLFLFRDLSKAVAGPADQKLSLEERAKRLWSTYIAWGMENPIWYRAMNLLTVTDILTEQTRKEETNLLSDPELVANFVRTDVFKNLPHAYGEAIFVGIADATLSFALRDPSAAEHYISSGFQAWSRVLGK